MGCFFDILALGEGAFLWEGTCMRKYCMSELDQLVKVKVKVKVKVSN